MNENNDFRSEEQGFSDPNNLYHYNYREQHSAPNEQGRTEAPVVSKKKNSFWKKTGVKVTALVLACAVVGGGAGFGGAALARSVGAADSGTTLRQSGRTAQEVTVKKVTGQTLMSPAEVYASTVSSVVSINSSSVSTNIFGQRVESASSGRGFVVTQDGYIVTNHHVIEGATSILVRTRSGDEYSAELIGSDEQSDLAVLKIDASGLTPAVLGDSTKLEVGDLAVVIGNPLGELGGTVTSGIISALDREVSIDGQMMTLMQTDAAVNPGNSGGGLFDANGDLVGIINAKSSGDNVEGLGFAIPISNATDIIDELIANGEVTSRPTLGVSLYDVTDRNTAAQLGVDSTGVYIVQIVQGGSADRAGLQTGDRIISVDGTEVNSTEEVRTALNEHSTGEQMNMEIERDGNTIEVMVSL